VGDRAHANPRRERLPRPALDQFERHDGRDDPIAGDYLGDAGRVWDLLAARRARALGIGVLSGGYGREELIYSGAFRVYDDARDLLDHLDEVGVRRRL
jgi:phosphoglycolate phosphatase-like HAD superfamily hydrolase